MYNTPSSLVLSVCWEHEPQLEINPSSSSDEEEKKSFLSIKNSVKVSKLITQCFFVEKVLHRGCCRLLVIAAVQCAGSVPCMFNYYKQMHWCYLGAAENVFAPRQRHRMRNSDWQQQYLPQSFGKHRTFLSWICSRSDNVPIKGR